MTVHSAATRLARCLKLTIALHLINPNLRTRLVLSSLQEILAGDSTSIALEESFPTQEGRSGHIRLGLFGDETYPIYPCGQWERNTTQLPHRQRGYMHSLNLSLYNQILLLL